MKPIFSPALIALCLIMPIFSAYAAVPNVDPGQKQKGYIVGGKPAQEGKYPWMVALLRSDIDDSTEAQFCGGTLIAPDIVLTAAHCAQSFFGGPLDPSEVEILHGSNSLPFSRGPRISVIGVIAHPDFNNVTLEHDFAMLKLGEKLSGPFIEPAFSSELSLVQDGTKSKVIGWGQTDPTMPVLPVELQEGPMKVISDAKCLNNIGRWFKPETMVCAATPPSIFNPQGVSACYGDSGGPLFVELEGGVNKQIGIVSWGFSCDPKDGFKDVFSEVSSGEDFIFQSRIFPPFFSDDVTVTGDQNGTASVGTTLTCSYGSLLGDPADSLYFTWQSYSNENGYSNIAEGEDLNTYTVTEQDAGNYVSCLVKATNSGGSIEKYSSNEVFVDALVPTPTSEPTASPTPTPTATPEPTPTETPTPTVTPTSDVNTNTVTDSVSPVSLVKSFSCSKSTCRLLFDATDSGAVDSKVAAVEVVLKRQIQKICKTKSGAKYTCSTTKTESLQSNQVKGSKWKTVAKRGTTKFSQVFNFSIQAIDSVGNIQSAPTKYKRKLKKLN